MRAIFIVSLSAALFGGCSTTQENPIYQQSSTYQNGSPATQHYAHAPVTQAAQVAQTTPYEPGTHSGDVSHANYEATTSYPVFAHRSPAPALVSYETVPYETVTAAPTDTAYGTDQVTGTPGFMAMQGQNESVATGGQLVSAQPAQTASSSGYGSASVYGAAGTPIAYDYSRNLVSADALTTGQLPDETIRVLPQAGQNYTVQAGDTVYSLSRRTCVGVNIIQSMNGIGADYGIQIGQSITLPASVC